jgi:hypothetical protein
MKLAANILASTTLESLVQPRQVGLGLVLIESRLFTQNLQEVAALQTACRKITAFVLCKRIRLKALLDRMRSKPATVVRLQAALRGHLCRTKNQRIVDKIRRDGRKGTRKYKAAARIQALFRGFAFRVKRKRALARLAGAATQAPPEAADPLDPLGDDDFDAEAFLDVKQENLEEVDIFAGANEGLLEKYIQVLSYDHAKREGKPPP